MRASRVLAEDEISLWNNPELLSHVSCQVIWIEG